MPGILDWLFGAGPLKKAAGQGGTAAAPPTPFQPGISQSDIAAAAQRQAAASHPMPLVTPPVAPVRGPAVPAAKPARLKAGSQQRPGGQ